MTAQDVRIKRMSRADFRKVCSKSVFLSQRVFYNSVASYKGETKSVKSRAVYLNRIKWIVRNSTK